MNEANKARGLAWLLLALSLAAFATILAITFRIND